MPTIDRTTCAAVESFVIDWMDDNGIPGASLALVKGDELVYADGFGARDVSENLPSTSDTLYGIGSITKSFTALAIQQLAEDGELELTDPISEYVDRYTDAPGDPISIHQLLTHTSGLPSDGSAAVLIARLMGAGEVASPITSDSDFSRHLWGALEERLTDEDEHFFYYNSGYTVLGEVVESITGKSYEKYVQEQILEPLGMTRSTFDSDSFEKQEDRMTPYFHGEGGLETGSFPFDETIYAPGGLLSSVTEMSNYLRMNMNGGEFEGNHLLSSENLAELHEPASTRLQYLNGETQRYGCGWMISDLVGDRLIGHGGSIGVCTAYLGFLEEAAVGVVLQCSTSPKVHPMNVGPAILAIVQGEDPTNAVPQFGLDTKLDAVTGDYESYRGITTATVDRVSGGLTVEYGSGRATQKLLVLPESTDPTDFEFYTVTPDGSRTPVRFEQTTDSMEMFVDRWRLHRA
ncbi:serine hydrolase [Haloprofundus salinisoli]|uniref:serine hydrolase n=1 Tax=Haloprofundus salinisoli TaxID=2876193 RepID=UPI001CCBEFC8|nr:serine hydrolase [Haloprofundus salinisoli]